jgi:transcriptional regulator with XRE-family HTH domain
MKKNILLLSIGLILLFSCQSNTAKLSPSFYKSIGGQIRTIRLEQGMSQQALADSVGITQNALSLIEDGLATPIHTKLIAIENFFEVTFIIEGEQISIENYLRKE